tara:strand:- start:210 stop:386 length:177 start_codon:yes stop_codon:yes gene_type:complete
MNKQEALKIVGKNQPKWAIKNMQKALSMCQWLNTEEETKRLEACNVLLSNRKEKGAWR